MCKRTELSQRYTETPRSARLSSALATLPQEAKEQSRHGDSQGWCAETMAARHPPCPREGEPAAHLPPCHPLPGKARIGHQHSYSGSQPEEGASTTSTRTGTAKAFLRHTSFFCNLNMIKAWMQGQHPCVSASLEPSHRMV